MVKKFKQETQSSFSTQNNIVLRTRDYIGHDDIVSYIINDHFEVIKNITQILQKHLLKKFLKLKLL